MRREHGFTLVESLVTCTLLLLTTLAMGDFFVAFTRQGSRYENRQAAIQGMEKGMARITSLLAISQASTVTYDPALLKGLLFPVCLPSGKQTIQFDATGQPLYQAMEGFGLDGLGNLYEVHQPFTPTNYPAGATLPTAAALYGSTHTTLAFSLSKFTITGPTNGAFTVNLALQDKFGYNLQMTSTAVALN